MARLQDSDGVIVNVSDERAKVLLGRGYTTVEKPKAEPKKAPAKTTKK